MARMVPFPMLPTDSSAERRLYEGFLEQLDDAYVVYHSVDWVVAGRRGPEPEGEADFVIAHPEDGCWRSRSRAGGSRSTQHPAMDPDRARCGTHVLDEDPFHQAQGEMHSLVRILEGQPGWERWRPSFGYGVAFPDGRTTRRRTPARRPTIVIDRGDLDRLADPGPAGHETLAAAGPAVRRRGDGRARAALGLPGRGPDAAQAPVRRGGPRRSSSSRTTRPGSWRTSCTGSGRR